MNVGGLPWLENEHGFYWTMGTMLLAIGAVLGLMRWRRLL